MEGREGRPIQECILKFILYYGQIDTFLGAMKLKTFKRSIYPLVGLLSVK